MSDATRTGGSAGVVYLVGAGPGDPEFLTIAAKRFLGLGDVVLYDGLVNPQILRWASANAEQICVGKRGQTGIACCAAQGRG